MKWILVLNLLVLLGFTQGAWPFETGITHLVKRRALNRVARETSSDITDEFLSWIGPAIVLECVVNGRIDEANKLQNAHNEMKTCIQNKPILKTPKDEFIANIEECSKESIERANDCLEDNQKDFPKFILDFAKSMVNFIYDDFHPFARDLAVCVPRLKTEDVKIGYKQCVFDSTKHIETSIITDRFPTTQASFCQLFIPIVRCAAETIKNTCDRTANLDKFREDFTKAVERPCEEK